MTDGNDLIEYEEKHSELQLKFLEEIGLSEATDEVQTKKLESDEYWNFVQEEYNNGRK